MNQDAILKKVQKLHDNAKDGAVKISGIKYDLKFSRSQGVYIVTLPDSSEFIRLNFRKITHAKSYLKEYLAN